jgi:hypothetical protein
MKKTFNIVFVPFLILRSAIGSCEKSKTGNKNTSKETE